MPALTRRRALQGLAAAALPTAFAARAHHGWSSFDLDRPIYLEGKAVSVKWQNPHVELRLERPAALALPADWRSRPVPPQSASVDAPALLKKAVSARGAATTRSGDRMRAALAHGGVEGARNQGRPAALAVLGFTFKDEKGGAILRAEFLWLDGKTRAALGTGLKRTLAARPGLFW